MFSSDVRAYVDLAAAEKTFGSLQGHVIDGRVGVDWFPWSHQVGVSAEYSVTRVLVNQKDASYNANLDLHLNGPALYARYRF